MSGVSDQAHGIMTVRVRKGGAVGRETARGTVYNITLYAQMTSLTAPTDI